MSEVDPPVPHGRVNAFGVVVEADRGSLPFALLEGEPLVAWAVAALEEAGATLVDVGTPWSALAEEGLPVVLHDPLCPLTPPAFLVACVEHALDSAAVTVGVRPVTDTIKRVEDGYVGDTVDRKTLVQVVSPVVLPPSVVARLDEAPTGAFADLVTRLALRFPVRTLAAPPASRRVRTAEEPPLVQQQVRPASPAPDRH